MTKSNRIELRMERKNRKTWQKYDAKLTFKHPNGYPDLKGILKLPTFILKKWYLTIICPDSIHENKSRAEMKPILISKYKKMGWL